MLAPGQASATAAARLTDNRLLAALPREERDRLAALSVPFASTDGDIPRRS